MNPYLPKIEVPPPPSPPPDREIREDKRPPFRTTNPNITGEQQGGSEWGFWSFILALVILAVFGWAIDKLLPF